MKDYGIDENAEWIDLQGIGYCKGCDCCHKVNPGVCAVNDGLNELLRKYMNSEQVVIVSPVIFGCLNSSVKNFIDRTQPLFMPLQASKSGKTIMKGRYEKYPDLVFIGVCDNQDNTMIKTFRNFITTSNISSVSNKVHVKIIQDMSV